MAYGSIPLDKRLKDNIRNYKLTSLYDAEVILDLLKGINKLADVDVMITERHGEKVFAVGEWAGVDLEACEATKIRICEQIVANVYVVMDRVADDDKAVVQKLIDAMIATIATLGDKTYRTKELEIYADELDGKMSKQTYQVKNGDKTDELTGVLNKTYFENRLNIVDRSQVIPVAAVCININDWKYVNDNYGDEESDRLIAVIASTVKGEAKPDYIVGRVDGDVFNVVIPMPADGEAEEYVARVKSVCEEFEDPHIAPSVAVGIAYKENVESDMSEVFSDAEYAMFEDKIEVKNAPGYRARLTHGAEN